MITSLLDLIRCKPHARVCRGETVDSPLTPYLECAEPVQSIEIKVDLEERSRVQISHAGQKPADVNPTIADGGANGWKDGVVKII